MTTGGESSFSVPKSFVWGLFATCLVQAVAGIWLLATVVQRVNTIEDENREIQQAVRDMNSMLSNVSADVRVLLERTRPLAPRATGG